jgi:hypothetical protein
VDKAKVIVPKLGAIRPTSHDIIHTEKIGAILYRGQGEKRYG